MSFRFLSVTIFLLALSCLFSARAAAQNELSVLFLGDNGHHQPRIRFDLIQPVLAKRNIKLTYTDKLSDLNAENLAKYKALILYANIDAIEPAAEKALLDYVADGGGFVPLHCASFCFRNSDALVALMGAQFQKHGTGVFRTTIENSEHPIIKGFGGFESWDETYVHHLHNERDRTVLEFRVDAEGREPWSWVRTEGAGRVFYTAWGHDERTWNNPGFQNLVERGIRWAAKDDPAVVPEFKSDQPFPIPKITAQRTDVQPFEYVEAGGKIPNYTPGEKWGAQGEDFTKMQKPLSPDESLKHFVVPEGFHVELFAAEPDIGGKPICMAWDERGRLWIAETFDYPNELQPPGKGRDRIRILEDTDGDWKADKFTVFAEQLSIPTSITFHQGGVIVQAGTETLYLKDTDGDDVADQSRVMFTGWAQNDTHGGVSNFQYGLDNWIWAMQGYNDSHPAIDGKTQQAFRQGFFRFRPDGSEIEFIRSSNNNTWGLGISEEGIIFGSTANGNPSVYMPIPNRYYEQVKGWAKSLQLGTIADTFHFQPITKNVRQVDWHGGYTAGAGHALYTARQFPQEYWNRTAFVNGPTGHLVGTFILKSDESDFHSTSPFNLLASDDEWSAPIMTEIGPDGNAWVIDWYNYIVQHNPTPQGFKQGKGNAYETPLRDKKHGRIYRVVYGDRAKSFSLAGATPEELVEALKNPTMLWRKHAQRLLVERHKPDVVEKLIALVNDQSVDAIGLNVGAIHALRTLQGLNQLDGSNEAALVAAVAALKHPSAGVRRNAVQALPIELKGQSRRNQTSTQLLLDSGVIDDRDAQVRLAAMLALADLTPNETAANRILKFIEDNSSKAQPDNWLNDAAISAAANNAADFLKALASSQQKPTPAILEAAQIVAGHFARSNSGDSISEIFNQLASADPAVGSAVINGLTTGWTKDNHPTLTPEFESSLTGLMKSLPNSSKGQLVKLARSMGSNKLDSYVDAISKSLNAKIDDDDVNLDERIKAVQEMVEFRQTDDSAVKELLDRLTPQLDPAMAIAIVESLRASEARTVGPELVHRFAKLTPQTRAAGIRVLLSRRESTQELLVGIESGEVLISELTLEQKQALMSHAEPPIRELATKLINRGGGVPDPDRQRVYLSLLPITQAIGNVTAGKEVFKKVCANCHMHTGEGQKIGPDLTGVSVHPKTEMLTNIIDPNRDVEANYRIYKVMTVDGLLINGLLASESKTAIEMFDTEGKKHVVLREDIEQMEASTKSLMPEGFEKQISPEQMTDLLEFMAAHGKYVPLDISKSATIASDRGMFYGSENETERLIFSDWSPKTFKDIPFVLTDPNDGRVKNAILLNGPIGTVSQKLPKSVRVTCNMPAKAIHLLSGVSGWGFPFSQDKSVSLIVRLHYVDGKTEDHELLNGVHFADYIRRVEVEKSEFAFALRDQQLRYLAITPNRAEPITEIEFVKGPDQSAPIVMAVTLEPGDSKVH